MRFSLFHQFQYNFNIIWKEIETSNLNVLKNILYNDGNWIVGFRFRFESFYKIIQSNTSIHGSTILWLSILSEPVSLWLKLRSRFLPSINNVVSSWGEFWQLKDSMNRFFRRIVGERERATALPFGNRALHDIQECAAIPRNIPQAPNGSSGPYRCIRNQNLKNILWFFLFNWYSIFNNWQF